MEDPQEEPPISGGTVASGPEVFVAVADIEIIGLAAANTKGAAMNAIRLCSSLKLDFSMAEKVRDLATGLANRVVEAEENAEPAVPFVVQGGEVGVALIGTGFEIGKMKTIRESLAAHKCKTGGVDRQIARLWRIHGDLGGTPELPLPESPKEQTELES